MPFEQKASEASNTFGTFNDIQRDQYNVVIHQNYTAGTPQRPLLPWETTSRHLHRSTLPPRPHSIKGRDGEMADVVGTLLKTSPARVAIMGGGGMGKTTLALGILHEPAVVEQYPSRYFVTCEGVLSIPSLVEGIANALRIPLANRDASLIDTVLSSFPAKTLLCLDNIETLWDHEEMRPDIEELLSALQQKVMGLIITMRGTQRPSRVFWSEPLLSPLEPFGIIMSSATFYAMTGKWGDAFVQKLLLAVDGIPLAVSLIVMLLQEGNESSRSLWNRWTKSGVLESGGSHRLSNLNTSIHLSVYGPRMTADPTTIDILAMLSVLPDGFPDDDSAVEKLQSHLPESYDLQKALLTLRRVSLVHVNKVAAPRRLRMLSPIISFCQHTLKGSEDLRNGITSYYVQLIGRFENVMDGMGHQILPDELQNVRAALMQAWRRGKGDDSVMMASIQFTLWSIYLGNPVEEVVCAALQGGVGKPDLQAYCHHAVGEVYLRQYKFDDAEASFKHAAELHQQAHDIAGEANALRSLGKVHLRQYKLDDAEASFKHAAELHQQAHNTVGEANALRNLGEVHLRRYKLDDAEASFKHAANLHQQSNNISGEATALQSLGEVYMQQDKLGDAEQSFIHAIRLHGRAHNIIGEGNGYQKLGELSLQRHKLGGVFNPRQQTSLGDAEEMLGIAMKHHQQAHDILGEGNDNSNLAVVFMRQQKLDDAEASLKRAIQLHQQAHDVVGEGNDLRRWGQLWVLRGRMDNAEASYKRATELHRQVHDLRGEGDNLKGLGYLYLLQDKLDEAEESFKLAAELHRQVHNVREEKADLELLTWVYTQRSKLHFMNNKAS